jgi:hypothetical protein
MRLQLPVSVSYNLPRTYIRTVRVHIASLWNIYIFERNRYKQLQANVYECLRNLYIVSAARLPSAFRTIPTPTSKSYWERPDTPLHASCTHSSVAQIFEHLYPVPMLHWYNFRLAHPYSRDNTTRYSMLSALTCGSTNHLDDLQRCEDLRVARVTTLMICAHRPQFWVVHI